MGESDVTNPMVCERESDAHLVIQGGIRPHCGHGGDTQSLGVCWGLQAAVSIPARVGWYCPFPLIFFYSLAWMIWLCLFFFFFLWQINNAGCMVHKRELNAEGLEKNFATNTMGETSFWGSNSAVQVTVLSLFRSLHPHPRSHTTSTEEPGSQGGMNTTPTNTHNHSAYVRHVDSIMPLLSTLQWLLSKHTVPLFSPTVRSLCPQEACWSRNSE